MSVVLFGKPGRHTALQDKVVPCHPSVNGIDEPVHGKADNQGTCQNGKGKDEKHTVQKGFTVCH
jgi:hypothetical protein